ncbi:hypothetical protein J1N35_012289, partial [Gossypium stocksii]
VSFCENHGELAGEKSGELNDKYCNWVLKAKAGEIKDVGKEWRHGGEANNRNDEGKENPKGKGQMMRQEGMGDNMGQELTNLSESGQPSMSVVGAIEDIIQMAES